MKNYFKMSKNPYISMNFNNRKQFKKPYCNSLSVIMSIMFTLDHTYSTQFIPTHNFFQFYVNSNIKSHPPLIKKG